MEIYLDNAATSKPSIEVIDIINKTLEEDFGNPSSRHIKGVIAERYLKNSQEILSKILKCKEREIYFNSGATESNNTAIFGAVNAKKRKGNHIITTAVEHASVREPFLALKKQGFDVTFLPVDRNGLVSLDSLRDALREDTIFVSMMYVNNEIGTIEPVIEAGKIIKNFNEDIIYHVDAVQAFGKIEKIAPKYMYADLMSFSAHKFHGPKGSGFLYIKDGVNIEPLIYGGGQQSGMRSGTENVPGIAGMGVAASNIYTKELSEKIEKLYNLREYFINELKKIENVSINGFEREKAAPHIVSATFKDIKSEVLLHALEEENIYVSSGSACSSNCPGLSFSLGALGKGTEILGSTIRFSFNLETNKQELDTVISVLIKKVPFLRQFVRK